MQRDVSMGRMIQITHTHTHTHTNRIQKSLLKICKASFQSNEIIDFELANRHKYLKLDKP